MPRRTTARSLGWAEQRTLLTVDGVPVVAVHRPHRVHRPPALAGGVAYVVAHGFTGSWRSPGLARVGRVLAESGGVVAFDFRGHGRSGGLSTLGDLEVLDLDAAVRWARLLGYSVVATVGFSMGGSVVVRHAAMHGGVDAVVSVSSPSRWFYRGTTSMRVVHHVVERPALRRAASWSGRVRIDPDGWDPLPAEPRALAGAIAPTPFLVVHGDRDAYFPLDHAEQLAAAGGPTATLWVERGFGHAEAAIDDDLTRRIAGWVSTAVGVSA
jgi:pimeloyl-ACP methyl ester carboxylesterase